VNSRERVIAVLEHRPVDRLPLGFFAVDHDTVSRVLGRETYLRAKAKSQIALWEGRRDEVAQSWREDAIEFYGKMNLIDIIPAHAMASSVLPPADYEPQKPEQIAEDTWRHSTGRIYRYSPKTEDITCIENPELARRTFTPEDFPVPDKIEPPDQSCFEVVDAVIEAFQGERFVIGPSGNEAAMIMIGDNYERGLLEFGLNPDTVCAVHRQALAAGQMEDDYYIRPGQDAVLWGMDFSYNSGPMISPKTFRDICLPNIKARVKSVHRRGLKVIKHACGNNNPLLEYFIQAGYDCYQSIQKSAGMNLEELRRNHGTEIALWGGVQVEHLVAGTPKQVRADVAEAFRIAAETGGEGGFILGTSHSVAVGTRYENFMAMLDEAEKLNERYFG
jgi:uroporphyrinogen-III decarboxylase